MVLAKTSAKNGFIFLEAILDFSSSHKYLHLGNLNPINILKCPNNLEGIFRLLRTFSNVPLNIFRFFLNGIVFLLFQNTEQKQIKRKTESREETYLAAHLAAQHCAGPRQSAACSRQSRQRGDAGERELATAPAACRPAADELADLPRRAPSPWTSSFSPIASPSPFPHHGRRRRSHLTGVTAATIDLAPY